MGKRSDFPARPRDYWRTPRVAVEPLVRHLRGVRQFAEPCAGDGALIAHIAALKGAHCVCARDLEPQGPGIARGCAFDLTAADVAGCDAIITNPPWSRSRKKDSFGYPLIPLIEHCTALLPTWFLIDADFMHIAMAAPVMRRCAKVISVGRVRWVEYSDSDGKDNACWYLFTNRKRTTRFVERR